MSDHQFSCNVANCPTCDQPTPTPNDPLDGLPARVEELERKAHEPYDFTHLVRRLEALEATNAALARERDEAQALAEAATSGGSMGCSICKRLVVASSTCDTLRTENARLKDSLASEQSSRRTIEKFYLETCSDVNQLRTQLAEARAERPFPDNWMAIARADYDGQIDELRLLRQQLADSQRERDNWEADARLRAVNLIDSQREVERLRAALERYQPLERALAALAGGGQ